MINFKKTLFALICGIVLTGSMTSCLDSNDNGGNTWVPPTEVEKAAAIAAATGSYTGKVHTLNQSSQQEFTSDVNFRIYSYDTLLVAHDFPVSAFANLVSEYNVKQILQNAPVQEFMAKVRPYYVATDYYEFAFVPTQELAFKSTDEKGVSYDVKVSFADYLIAGSTTYQPIAVYQKGKKSASDPTIVEVFGGNILISNISVGGVEYNVNALVAIQGTKNSQ